MTKLFIKNRKGQKIAVVVEQPEGKAKGLVFVMHGLGAFKEQPQISTIAQAFVNNNYIAIRFDARNTYGESEGNYLDANVTNYLEDLEDVIKWASSQDWYQEPFILSGSSLGAMCCLLYAEKEPTKVKAIFPKATVISGELSLKTYPKEQLKEWEKTGLRIDKSESKPGLIKKLNWHQFKQDSLKYDVLDNIHKLTMPVFVCYGSEDKQHFEHLQRLFAALPGPKDLQIIKGALHTIKDPEHLKELKAIFDKWIKSL